MAVEPIRTRCGECQQLLGVSPSKAGTYVACPRCGADVLVPEPAGYPASVASASPRRVPIISDIPDDPDDGISLDLIDIRPEDIRVVPGAPELEPEAYRKRPLPAEESVPPLPFANGPPISAPEPEVEDDEEEDEKNEADPDLPAIQLDTRRPSRSQPRTPPVRPSDLVLPRTVVAAWSLLVLMAVSFAFLAGLLIGHYVWRVH